MLPAQNRSTVHPEPLPQQRPRIGFLWETALKPWERHIYRQVAGSTCFRPVVLCRRVASPITDLPFELVKLNIPKKLWKKLYLKYVQGAPRCTYNRWGEGLERARANYQLRLIHVFFGTKAISYLPALREMDIPLSVSFHGRDVGECLNRPELAAHMPDLFRRADCIMARSHHMADRLIAGGCKPSKIWINRAGIPMDDFPLYSRPPREADPVTFLQACRLIPKKGVTDTLLAFQILQRSLPKSRLWIAGDGESREELEAMAEELALNGTVTFLGGLSQRDLNSALRAADVFVHPSVTTGIADQEGIPNSMLEAMATGLASIATRHGGIPEAVKHGETGWLVDESSPRQLAETMLHCASNLPEVREVGLAASRSVNESFSLRGRMRELDKKYESLISERAAAAWATSQDRQRRAE